MCYFTFLCLADQVLVHYVLRSIVKYFLCLEQITESSSLATCALHSKVSRVNSMWLNMELGRRRFLTPSKCNRNSPMYKFTELYTANSDFSVLRQRRKPWWRSVVLLKRATASLVTGRKNLQKSRHEYIMVSYCILSSLDKCHSLVLLRSVSQCEHYVYTNRCSFMCFNAGETKSSQLQ